VTAFEVGVDALSNVNGLDVVDKSPFGDWSVTNASDCLGRDRDEAAAGGGPNKGRMTADIGEAGEEVPKPAKGSCDGTGTETRSWASNSMNGLRHTGRVAD
jgi:hypothetical protein